MTVSWLFILFQQRFFCGGRLIFGPDVASLILSTFLIAGPAIAFCTRMFIKINHENTKHVGRCYSILIMGALLAALVSFLFCWASGTELCLQNSILTHKRNVLNMFNF